MQDSVFLKTLNGELTDRLPVWFMRQAGRYLPEYRELRQKNSMLSLIRTPELAAEVTLQPIRRFDLDAAIIFADILNPLIGMGANLDFKVGEGPVIDNPITCPADVDKLLVPTPEENIGYTLEAIKITCAELKKKNIPLIGFAGAPFTLSCYLIEGSSPKDAGSARRFAINHPEAWANLQNKLVKLISEYLVAQARAGASALQIFDSWLGFLSPVHYEELVEPYLHQIISNVKKEVQVPIIFFSTGTAGIFNRFSELGVNAVGVDWRMPLSTARKMIGEKAALQGNLDQLLLTGPWQGVETSAKRLLREAKGIGRHIFNVGHGLVPDTKIDNVSKLVELVHTWRG